MHIKKEERRGRVRGGGKRGEGGREEPLLVKKKNKGRVQASFAIELHGKDKTLLESLKSFFGTYYYTKSKK